MNKKSTSMSAALPACFVGARSRSESKPVWAASAASLKDDLKRLPQAQRAWVEANAWKADAGSVIVLPSTQGGVAGAVLGLGNEDDPARRTMLAGALPQALPEGNYHFAQAQRDPELAALAWAMGAYRFTRYKAKDEGRSSNSEAVGQTNESPRCLVLPKGVDAGGLASIAGAVALGRDLINTPANDLGPAELEKAARKLAGAYGAKIKVTTGGALLKQNFPLIHAVGRASDREPRLIDFTWGRARAPKLTLVGKGITYDTGGLSLKPTSGMALMKKDMGGAASVLALASMIMAAGLNLRLRVLIPAADNNVSANAFRPGDILSSHNGMSVEIGNTDAEGRLVLADALALADKEKPDTLVTIATLTGAARVALGPDLPPLYANNDRFAQTLLDSAAKVDDPLWRMPFWEPYDARLKGKVGDVSHISDGAHAGSVTAALFLKRFVSQAACYAHLDIYGWVPRAKPGRPEGGEPQGARALFQTFHAKYSG
ncbi:MAG: M17 family metallopeptidase [Methyloligellaceae bacterium]